MKIEQTLKEFGLDEKEIAVYLSLLQLGGGSILDIASQSKVKRTTVYEIIKNLKNKNLIYIGYKKSKKLWYPQSSEQIIKIQKDRYEHLKAILPELRAYWSESTVKPKIQYFEGILP